MAKVLVIRLSALGDVAMLVPVISSVAAKYPQDRFYVMTRVAFVPLFEDLSFNIIPVPVDTKGKHKGFIGLLKLVFGSLFSGYTHVADVHDVLRSKIIRWLMMLSGRKVRHIDKGRGEKRKMIESKVLQPPLQHSTERYLNVFSKLGFPAEITFHSILDFASGDLSTLHSIVGEKKGIWIGIAPFARHKGKMYPEDRMERIVKALSEKNDTEIFLFGGGPHEKEVLSRWAAKYEHVTDLSGKLSLDKELLLMSYLDVIVTMDSANMHLASLVRTPVVSVWGATHPSVGFYGYNQDIANAIQIDLPCRPCSVFGDLPCILNGSYECMKGISEQMVLDKIQKVLDSKKKNTNP